MLTFREDHREPRDWGRPWRHKPGFFIPGCPCCSGGANGYSCGGDNVFGTTLYATTDRTAFSTELTSAVSGANLSQARGEPIAVANPDSSAYIAGGRTTGSAAVATADKLTFSSETTAAQTTANLSTARYALGGMSERSTKGYYSGGFSSATSIISDKLTFSTDATAAQTTADLTVAAVGQRSLTEGSTKGYIGGGGTGSLAWTANTDKLTFSTDATAAQTTANLTTGRDRYHAVSDGSAKGYFAGGQTGIYFSICDKVTFSTDVTVLQTSAAIIRAAGSAMSDGTNGLIFGGVGPSGVDKSGLKLNFSTDISSALAAGADLSVARYGPAGASTAAL